jgi:hypothetical protein
LDYRLILRQMKNPEILGSSQFVPNQQKEENILFARPKEISVKRGRKGESDNVLALIPGQERPSAP